jgi:NADH-quinone oxidoreductase subunit N
MMLCGLYYKLAVFPFHFWTPDVYQGASNENRRFDCFLPKVAGVAVLVRFLALASPDNHLIATLLALLAGGSMFYGNLAALMQKDFKRLLGFSGIAHAGYALLGFVALGQAGSSAALLTSSATCSWCSRALWSSAKFPVMARMLPSKNWRGCIVAPLVGRNARSRRLCAGRSTSLRGLYGQADLLSAALDKGYLALVIIAVINAAIAVYYYLGRHPRIDGFAILATCLRSTGWPTRALCVVLIGGILVLGVAPTRILGTISTSVAGLNSPLAPPAAATAGPLIHGSEVNPKHLQGCSTSSHN